MSKGSVSKYLKTRKPSETLSLLTLPLAIIYCELFARLFVLEFPIDMGLIYVPFIGFAIGALLTIVAIFLGEKGRVRFTAIFLGIFGFYYCFHSIYTSILHAIFSWRNLFLANAITEFFGNLVTGVLVNSYMILIFFLPLILFLVFNRRYYSLPDKASASHKASSLISLVMAVIIALTVTFIPENRDAFLYMKNDFAKTYRYYGITMTTMIEIGQMIFGSPEEKVENPYLDPNANIGQQQPEIDPETGIEYGYNILDIDFDALIENAPNETVADMHKYFASVPATQQNEYTGMFEGKNLIFLTLEGFSSAVIDPNATPTLYKMYNEGFRFTNFYSIWGGSTASGEFTNMTGNFYTAAGCLKESANTLQYSSLGNLFKGNGYDTYAYHNHTYSYYSRNISHPNFGYKYKGIGNGLVLDTMKCWPRSDYEMAKATWAEYMNSDKPFHAYYMTVSGHYQYTWTDNSMCSRHRKDEVIQALPYSEHIKAYYACQREVDLMLEELINQLDAAGKLEDTVFAMACDHFPYVLTDEELSELYGLPADNIRENFDLYKNGFILWSASMEEPITIDTPASSYDIVPTLCNLFGIEYDSRIITGKDILSNAEKIVMVNGDEKGSTWNWITEKGKYNTSTKEFFPSDKCDLSGKDLEEYIRITNLKFKAMRKYSHAILDKDYYSYIFNKDGTLKK